MSAALVAALNMLIQSQTLKRLRESQEKPKQDKK